MKRAIFLLLLGWIVGNGAFSARATPGWTEAVNVDPASGVAIELSSPFERVPSRGYVPCIATIRNHSGGTRQWTFDLESSSGYSSNRSTLAATQTVRVENDREVRVSLLLPVAAKARGTYTYRSVLIHTRGYGLDRPQQNSLPTNYRNPKAGNETVFVGMSEKLAHDLWTPLSDYFKPSSELAGSSLDLTLLPPDWRALAGVQCLWLTPEDFTTLDSGQQTAIKQWVGYGGSLFLCETMPDQTTRTAFGLDDPAGKDLPSGFGDVTWVPYDGKQLSVHETATRITGVHQATNPDPSVGEAKDWPLAKAVGALRLNVLFLIVFIGAFAILVGPVNLFYIARQGRRHRLFWTTPLISLAASLLLVTVIVLEDGFGGNGSRVSLTYLLPAQNEAVVTQEQLSRTGVLLSHNFTAREDLFLTPLDYKVTNNGQEYEQSGRFYSGGWYASRSMQAQRADAVLPTRARVDLLNAEQARAGAAPVVVSSLPVELDEFQYIDAAGRPWWGQHLRTGERQTLRAGSNTPPITKTGGSLYLDDLLHASRGRRGDFCASAQQGQFLDTLPSIRWNDERAIILGPVTPTR